MTNNKFPHEFRGISDPHGYAAIEKRYGVKKQQAKTWLRAILNNVVHLETQPTGREVWHHMTENVTLVYEPRTGLFVTAIDKPAEKIKTTSRFLDGTLAAMDRELRRMTVEMTRQSRILQKEAAEMVIEQAQLGLNRVKCLNPKNQKSIDVKMAELQFKIDMKRNELAALMTEFYRAKTKLELFIASSGDQKEA